MANYRNYAENLIGNWNTDQYAPQREVIKSTYNTNWDKLQNDFTVYMDRLNRNLNRARTNYHDTLANAAENSYIRTNSALQDLSNKGLIGSGLAEKYAASDNASRGKEINAALEKIINTRTGYEGSLVDAVGSMAEKENKLNQNFAKGLGDLTGAEQGNLQNYANLIAGLANSAEGRELSNALAKARLSLNAAKLGAEEEEDELARRQRIYDTLATDKMTDSEKVRNMSIYLDVPSDVGEELIKAYKNNQDYAKNLATNEKQQEKLAKYQEKLDKYKSNKDRMYKDQTHIGMSAWGDLKDILGIPRANTGDTTNIIEDYYNNRIANAQSKITDDLNYMDLYKILYGNKQ